MRLVKTSKKVKMIMPYKICLLDIMWYLREIVVCNLYDRNNKYNIDTRVISEYPFVINLSDILKNCLEVKAFVDQGEVLDSFFVFQI